MECHDLHDSIKLRIRSFDYDLENTNQQKTVTPEFWEYYKLMLKEAEARHLLYCEVVNNGRIDFTQEQQNKARETMKTYFNAEVPKTFI